ncbi:MAG: DUF1295 domain-containing protein [Chlamydiia bacterium]|nr:DUF1295 domain-containing protein [Chlamydiia bacterium]
MQVLWLFGLGLTGSLGLMTLLWIYYLYKRNAGIVDLGWIFCFLLTYLISITCGSISAQNQILLSLMVLPWALRLGWHLWDRYQPSIEDPRYTAIKKNWGKDPYGVKFLGMFLLQGALAAFVSAPFYVIGADAMDSVGWLGVLGFLITVVAFVGEAIADYQLREFRNNPENIGKICDKGLWALTRHPNYFFEWLVWVGITLFALENRFGPIALISPVIMYYLLRYVSGVPMLEKHMMRSKKEAWEAYKARVPEFFPKIWP